PPWSEAPAPTSPTPSSTGMRPVTPGPARPATPRPAAAPPRRPPARATGAKKPPAPAGLTRTFYALFLGGILLLAVGAGLLVTFYPDVVHATDAATFLADSGAQQWSGNPTVNVVKLTTNSYSAGDTVVIRDTVSSATYNTSSGTTALTFRSIDNQPASDRAALQTLSQDLFGTLSGHPSWITAGTAVVMTFTVVTATLPPGGNYPAQSYVTLSASADATQHAISTGTTGAGAVAIGSQYYQHYPATLYDGVFYFLLAIGAF